MNDLKSFVKLKYEIITADSDKWHLLNTYPAEVRNKWAWRCAEDVEYLAKSFPEAEKCIEIAKKYRNGLVTKEELGAAYAATKYACADYAYAAYGAACAAYAAAYADDDAAIDAADAAACAACAAANAAWEATSFAKWDLYIGWLVEELYNYHSTQSTS